MPISKGSNKAPRAGSVLARAMTMNDVQISTVTNAASKPVILLVAGVASGTPPGTGGGADNAVDMPEIIRGRPRR
jgi:hypothetical protein